MFRYGTKIIVILLLCSVLIVSSLPVYAQDEIEEPAEIVAQLDLTGNKIPAIKVSEWTPINITVTDAFGINWSYLSSSFPLMSRYWWPIRHPNWRPFLGYSSLRFDPEIVEGDPRGWYTRVTPSAIAEADQGKTYDLKLEVQTDDIAVDYAVVVGIKTTRINVYGQEVGVSYIYIPVKSSALNNIKMETSVTEKEGSPHSYVHFEVTVKNLGYYKDMFKLEFEESGLIVAATKQLIVLNPDESKTVGIDVLTPEKFYDPGTPYPIKILAASSGDPIPMHIGTIVVITKGIYIPILAGIITVPIVIFLAILYLLFYYYRERKERKIFGKPEKPWTIPDEKRHLEELKQKNKEEFEKERQMMEDEYKSAMLWFKNYREAERQREKKEISESKQGGISGRIFKKKEKQEKTDKEKTIDKKKQRKENKITQFLNKSNKKKLTQTISLTKKQKPKKQVKTKKVEKTKDVDKIQVQEAQRNSEEQKRKERLLLQIKRDQDKQKKMIK